MKRTISRRDFARMSGGLAAAFLVGGSGKGASAETVGARLRATASGFAINGLSVGLKITGINGHPQALSQSTSGW